jgi:hypothetical protein
MKWPLVMLAVAGAAPRADGNPVDADEGVTAAIGFAGGGAWTPGGLHVDGGYVLGMSQRDWLDIGIGATIGGGGAACFSDRTGGYTCDHSVAQGDELGFRAGARHYFNIGGSVEPFVRGGAGVSVVRFPDDVVSTMTLAMGTPVTTHGMYGVALTAHGGGGARIPISPVLALLGAVEVNIGVGGFAGTADAQRQMGFAVTLGAELRR